MLLTGGKTRSQSHPFLVEGLQNVRHDAKSAASKRCNLREAKKTPNPQPSPAGREQQVFTRVSREAEGENAAAGEQLENRAGFYIYTGMREGGEPVPAHMPVSLSLCPGR